MSNQPDMKPFIGAVIRNYREEMNLTQDQLANSVGEYLGIKFHKSAISKIESGSRPLSLEEAVAISQTLLLPLQDLAQAFKPESDSELFDAISRRFFTIGQLMGKLLFEYDMQSTNLEEFQERIEGKNPLPSNDFEKIDDLKEVVELMKRHTNSMIQFLEWRLYTDLSFSKVRPLSSLGFDQFTSEASRERILNFENLVKDIKDMSDNGR